jgi:nitroimidazol reductase NimA-like FMN-containing flavoprotein (pyridoxamine 5'-phosphate oxidase superfamily)
MEDFSDPGDLLRRLFASQRLAVLATQDAGQPYGNLVAFAETDDLKHLIFVTSRNTQKYANVTENEKVALLIDSRRNQISDFQTAVAVTAIGAAEEITGNEREFLAKVYVVKHPHLTEFLNRPDSAVIKVTVSDYEVAGFDKAQSVHLSD